MHANLPTPKKICAFIPILFLYIIIIFITYISFQYFTWNPSFNIILKVILTILQYIFLLPTIFTHIQCILINPGNVSQEFQQLSQTSSKDIFGQYCNKCKINRPPRAHHCRKCNKCILKMDHHCPWIANCVGWYNHKIFFLFLFYAFAANAFFGVCSVILLIKYNTFIEQREDGDNIIKDYWKKLYPFWLIWLSLCVEFIWSFCLGIMIYRNINLWMSNSTLIEDKIYSKKEQNSYYNKNELESFKMVMGSRMYQWFIPMFIKSKANDGYYFGKDTNLKPNEEITIELTGNKVGDQWEKGGEEKSGKSSNENVNAVVKENYAKWDDISNRSNRSIVKNQKMRNDVTLNTSLNITSSQIAINCKSINDINLNNPRMEDKSGDIDNSEIIEKE